MNTTYEFIAMLKRIAFIKRAKRTLFLAVSVFCYTSCCQSQVNFSKEYKAANRGRFSFEVPEVRELVHIIFAITDGKNYLKKYIRELEAFAFKTGFRKFYEEHKSLYNNQITLAEKQMPIDKQWKWLEERFPNRYQNYRITFSPLVYGSHSTNHFGKDDFRQTIMFISGPIENSKLSEKVIEGLMTRVVFTEIDHNYVNPITDLHKKLVEKIFGNREKWTAGKVTADYRSAYSVFNEYMTWGVFTLNLYDSFSAEDFKAINDRTERQMMNLRGFSRFKEFNNTLLELYKKKQPDQTIADLYLEILQWCEQ